MYEYVEHLWIITEKFEGVKYNNGIKFWLVKTLIINVIIKKGIGKCRRSPILIEIKISNLMHAKENQ